MPLDSGFQFGYCNGMLKPSTSRPAPTSEGAKALGDWMDKRGFNQREAAADLKISHNTLNHYLSGYRLPSRSRANLLFEKLGIPQASWEDTLVAKRKSARPVNSEKRPYFQGGNASAR